MEETKENVIIIFEKAKRKAEAEKRIEILRSRLFDRYVAYTPKMKMGVIIEYFGRIIDCLDECSITLHLDIIKLVSLCNEVLDINYMMINLLNEMEINISYKDVIDGCDVNSPLSLAYTAQHNYELLNNHIKQVTTLLRKQYNSLNKLLMENNKENLKRVVIVHIFINLMVFYDIDILKNIKQHDN